MNTVFSVDMTCSDARITASDTRCEHLRKTSQHNRLDFCTDSGTVKQQQQ